MTNVQVDTYVDVAQADLREEDLRQEFIYDARYRANGYDRRSTVRVLRAENETLYDAADRLLATASVNEEMTLFDFGYGTGRVTNEFADSYHDYLARTPHSHTKPALHVIGYDISSAGLRRAVASLRRCGFNVFGDLTSWQRSPGRAYVASLLARELNGIRVQVTLIHGPESAAPHEMVDQVRALVGRQKFDIVTSWYSGLGHIYSSAVRRAYFRGLSQLTRPQGELVVAVSATGDLIEEQARLKSFLQLGGRVGYPCESPQDLLYRTELGQVNFWHVFDVDLNAEMELVASKEQNYWIRAIRFPGDEFESQDDELKNYLKVSQKNDVRRGERWTSEDFKECHTVAARLSSLPECWPNEGASTQ